MVHDPWPPNGDETRGEIYAFWMRRYPLSTRYVLQR